jgi:hypothetical protein
MTWIQLIDYASDDNQQMLRSEETSPELDLVLAPKAP